MTEFKKDLLGNFYESLDYDFDDHCNRDKMLLDFRNWLKTEAGQHETIVIGRTLMEGMDFLTVRNTGKNSKYGTIQIEFYHPDSELSDEKELCISIINSEMEKEGDYMPLSLNKVELGKLIDFLTYCKEAL